MNSITLFKENAPELLDKVYKQEATTSDFDVNGALVKAGLNANEIVIPKLTMDGLGDYDRASGYTDGDVTLTNETVKFNYERGRRLKTDAIDNEETGGVILANLANEFIRKNVVPEVDAVRYAQYASTEDISDTEETLSTASEVITAIGREYDKMTDAEVPESDRHLRITSTLLGLIREQDTTKSKEILAKFATVKVVPQSRFLTAIALKDGKTDGERTGGFTRSAGQYEASTDTTVVTGKVYYTKSGNVYTKVTSPTGNPTTSSYFECVSEPSKDINFMIIHKDAMLQYTKHAKTKVFTPEQDQDGDDYKMTYRIYGLNDIYENKRAGVACSHKA